MATCTSDVPDDEARWPKLRFSTLRTEPVTLAEKQVRACFEKVGEVNQHQVLLEIYRLVFPQWDQIAGVDGWPCVNKATWCAIARMFFDFDKKHHPSVMPGGCWMNQGFSSIGGERLQDWQVSLADVVIHWKEPA